METKNSIINDERITLHVIQPAGIPGFQVETSAGPRYVYNLADAERLLRQDDDLISDQTTCYGSKVNICRTYRTWEVAHEVKAQIEAAFPQAGYGTTLEVREGVNGGFTVTGYRYTSCD